MNVTDPDSKLIEGPRGVRAGLQRPGGRGRGADRARGGDHQQHRRLVTARPMVTATLAELERAGSSGRIETALADAQYWNEQHMDEVIANKHMQVLIPPDGGASGKQRSRLDRRALHLDAHVLASEHGERAIPKTQTDGRAGVRPHPSQPRCHPVPPKRTQRGAHRVAITDGDPQPHQAAPPPDRHRGGLKRPPRRSHRRSDAPVTNAATTSQPPTPAAPTFARSGGPGESHPRAPSDPGVTVSRHRALLTGRVSTRGPTASG